MGNWCRRLIGGVNRKIKSFRPMLHLRFCRSSRLYRATKSLHATAHVVSATNRITKHVFYCAICCTCQTWFKRSHIRYLNGFNHGIIYQRNNITLRCRGSGQVLSVLGKDAKRFSLSKNIIERQNCRCNIDLKTFRFFC